MLCSPPSIGILWDLAIFSCFSHIWYYIVSATCGHSLGLGLGVPQLPNWQYISLLTRVLVAWVVWDWSILPLQSFLTGYEPWWLQLLLHLNFGCSIHPLKYFRFLWKYTPRIDTSFRTILQSFVKFRRKLCSPAPHFCLRVYLLPQPYIPIQIHSLLNRPSSVSLDSYTIRRRKLPSFR